ncbi:hypothetical protein F3P66_05920 [Agrobacterium fabrum]|uniref:Uncharacterized protein n=1 Tax=Agrobacterium fabrum (strain C58 / ATCC 33970) TaxID=176299 RepID=Q7CYS0_AGRFC|nr:hypothetical protein Atu1674 [Agrobacterium fabrum str. C58]AYM57395.1 hypothetical protein At1D132_13780 [Agrobacterium fabrum]CAD0208572.1 hypothetical protein AGTUEHA105_LOCUS1347 [Agrobacterium tumefaciens]QRM60604.1 hypothetical protein F3P66_05920 [Agrobacterium fabrum]TRB27112.1 hypothetical protein EXN51_20805 [Agrobacterium fabrum]
MNRCCGNGERRDKLFQTEFYRDYTTLIEEYLLMYFKPFTIRAAVASLLIIFGAVVDTSSQAMAGHGSSHGIETRGGGGRSGGGGGSGSSAATGALIGLGMGLLLQGLANAPSGRPEASAGEEKSGDQLNRESRERWRRAMEAKKKRAENASADASSCVTFDRRSNSLADFIVNSCNVPIVVRWRDSGNCRTRCMSGAPAGERSTITKIKGSVSYTACQGAYCSPRKF